MDVNIYIPEGRPLSDAVQAFWQAARENSYSQEVIVPKGVVEIIFNFEPDTPFNTSLYGAGFVIPKCFIQGYHTAPITLDLPGSQSLFGAALHTAATKHIFGVPAGEFARKCIDLTLVDTSIHTLWHQLAESGTFPRRTALLTDWLMRRIPHLDARELAINDLFTLKTGRPLTVPGLADWLCYSPRHLSRKFHELSGMNTGQTILYLKYLKARALIHRTGLSLSEIAHICEFSDQSHFIKTFKSLAGLTPKQYRNRKSDIEGHYFENVRQVQFY
ncbi:MAG: AraC family transcriptional regulator [Balneolaceae bacterium]|nr:MAG: AraC family transcriptional regulator [Balneolaceae bacterium]